MTVESPSRFRRDPRTERIRMTCAGSRPRIQIRRAAKPAQSTPAIVEQRRAAPSRPPWSVLAVPDLEHGALSDHDLDVLGAAREIAGPHGAQVLALNTARGRIDWGRAGADRVLDVSEWTAERYCPEDLARLIGELVARGDVRHVVFPDNVPGGGDIGRRVAASLSTTAVGSVVRIELDHVTCSADGGVTHWRGPLPRIVMLAREGAEPIHGEIYEALPWGLPERWSARFIERASQEEMTMVSRNSTLSAGSRRIENLGTIAADVAAQPLTECDFILAGGLGVSDWHSFHRLAQLLGAAVAGTRPVCDAGLLPRERQVGASGVLVAPRCYIALGISGAPQHVQGIERCPRVVAVNIDPQADMLRRADLAIIADVAPVMNALVEMLSARAPGQPCV